MYKRIKILLLCLVIVGCDEKKVKKVSINSKIIQSVEKEDWYSASKLLNLNLNMRTNAPCVHLMNGFVYDKLAEHDPSYAGLSVVAYKRALNMDPNNWRYSLAIGRHYLREHDYRKAISAFAKTLMINDNNEEALYGMASAAYATRNVTLARNSIDKALKYGSNNLQVYRLAALIYASQNNIVKANAYANKYANQSDDLAAIKYLRQRLQDWQKTHRKVNQNIQIEKDQPEQPDASEQNNSNIIIECVVLSFDETGSFSKGNNFLETLQEFKKDEFSKGLSVRLENKQAIANVGNVSMPFYSNTSEKNQILKNGKWVLNDANMPTRVISKGFAIGFDSIRYNLNILNSSSSIIDIVSRPVIRLMPGGKGIFDSGDKLFVNTGGDVGSAISNIPSGIKLEIAGSEQVDPNNIMLNLVLEISKTTFKNASGSLNDSAKVIHANLNTQIAVKFNETISIGGVFSNVTESSKSGVPGLQNVPLGDLVLANRNSQTSKKSVMMLLTAKKADEVKQVSTDINEMYNIVLLKKNEPSFFQNQYSKEKQVKTQTHEYRKEDIQLMDNSMESDIKLCVDRIKK